MGKNNSHFNNTSILLIVFLSLTTLIVSSAIIYYFNAKKEIRAEAEIRISDLAAFKSNQIIEWRKERMGEANFIFNSLSFKKLIHRFLTDTQNRTLKNEIIQWIDPLVKNHEYIDALIVQSPSKVFSLYNEDGTSLDKYEQSVYKKVIDEKQPYISNIYFNNKNILILSAFIPLISSGNAGTNNAVFILHIDPQQLLFPLIKTRASLTETEETFIVRKDGDSVLFLMDLKKVKYPAMRYKAPLTNKSLPAVKAVLGQRGVTEGIDYNGNEVLTYISSIPEFSWFLISKIDQAEVYNPLEEKANYILAFCVLLLLVTGSGVITILKNQQAKFYSTQFILEKEKKIILEHLRLLLKYANDSILLLDSTGNVKDVNDKALQVYGYSYEEFLKLKINDIRAKTISESSESFDETKKKIDSTGGLIFQINHIKKNGDILPVEVSAVKINLEGEIFYQSIIRDISERLLAEKSLRESENRMNRSQEIAHLGSWELDLVSDTLTWSDEVYRIFGLQPQEFGASYEAFLNCVHPEDRDTVNEAYSGSLKNGKDSYEIEHRVISQSTGTVKFVHEKCEHIRDTKGNIIRSIGMVHDITEKRVVEKSLEEAQSTISAILDSISDAFFAVDTHWNLIYINKIARDFGFDEKFLNKNIWNELPAINNTLLEANCRKAVSENKVINFEWKPRLLNKWFNITAYPSVFGLSVYVQDVTHDINSKHKLKKMIKEREILIKEIHHRVKNNLQIINSLLNLQITYLNDDNLKKILLDSQNRIKSMALIHQELYSDNLARVNSKLYLESLIQNLSNSYNIYERKIIFNNNIQEKLLSIDVATPIGLIITEIIGNAFKYAFPLDSPGTIDFQFLASGDNNCLLKISDNGDGLPRGFDYANSPTLGFQLIFVLCEQINADIEISHESGTEFTIKFKDIE